MKKRGIAQDPSFAKTLYTKEQYTNVAWVFPILNTYSGKEKILKKHLII